MPYPTIDQMNDALGDSDEGFAFGGTIRRCRVCRTPTFGGPTLCVPCGVQLSAPEVDLFAGQWRGSA